MPSGDPSDGTYLLSSVWDLDYRVYNIGHGSPVKLMDFIEALEAALGIEAKKNFMPMQPGDVYTAYADTQDLFSATGYQPQVKVKEGVQAFVDW